MKLSLVLCALLIATAACANLNRPAMLMSEIDAINRTPGIKWKAGINKKFESATLEDVRRLCGALPSTGHDLPVVDAVGDDIPEEFDSRVKWPQCESIGHIRDQAECGSCWAFGASEAWTDRVCIHQDFRQPLSSEDLLACCGFSCGMGCNGGQLSGAWKFIKDSGLVTGGEYQDFTTCQPYFDAKCSHHVNGTYPPCGKTLPTPKCEKSCKNGANYNNDKHKASKSYAISSKEAAIQTEIMTNGPIEAAFSVYADFPTYKSGVYHHVSGSFLGGHAIKVLGWGVEAGTKYWLIANSWNEEWGNNGYFKILRGKNECGIESDGYAGL